MEVVKRVLTDRTDESVNSRPIFRLQLNDSDEENTIVSVAFTVASLARIAVSGNGDMSKESSEDKHVSAIESRCQVRLYNFIKSSSVEEPSITLTL